MFEHTYVKPLYRRVCNVKLALKNNFSLKFNFSFKLFQDNKTSFFFLKSIYKGEFPLLF